MTRFHLLLIPFILTGCANLGPQDPIARASAYLSTRPNLSEETSRDLIAGKRCSTEILQTLVDAPCAEVRALVAQNPSVSPELLSKLSGDKDAAVRAAVGARA